MEDGKRPLQRSERKADDLSFCTFEHFNRNSYKYLAAVSPYLREAVQLRGLQRVYQKD
jgi:hypothetical protein